MKKIFIGIAGVVLLIGIYIMVAYNGLITANEFIDSQWAQVETQYQRRFDLIPNLENSTKGIFEQEKDVFGALAEARTRYAGAQTPNDRALAASGVESALGRLLVVVENYPELRSSEAVTTLMAQLEGTENRIAVERKRYNDNVRDYNLVVKRFPKSMVASMFGFGEREYFEISESANVAPRVEF